jgi:DNA invertase Pin-like site-specific DNA recombinase
MTIYKHEAKHEGEIAGDQVSDGIQLAKKNGKLPVPAYQKATSKILVSLPAATEGQTAIYVRVSSHDQKSGMERQVAWITMWAAEYGIQLVISVPASGPEVRMKRTPVLAHEAPGLPEVCNDHCRAS